MVLFGVIACCQYVVGTVSYCIRLHGTVLCSMVRYGMVWYGTVCRGMLWYGMKWAWVRFEYGSVWFSAVWYGTVNATSYGTARHGTVRYTIHHNLLRTRLLRGVDEERAGHVGAVALVPSAHRAQDDVVAQVSRVALGARLSFPFIPFIRVLETPDAITRTSTSTSTIIIKNKKEGTGATAKNATEHATRNTEYRPLSSELAPNRTTNRIEPNQTKPNQTKPNHEPNQHEEKNGTSHRFNEKERNKPRLKRIKNKGLT